MADPISEDAGEGPGFDKELWAEAHRRDLLNPDQKSLYEEYQRRGLDEAATPAQRFSQGFLDTFYGAGELLEHVTPGATFRMTPSVKPAEADPEKQQAQQLEPPAKRHKPDEDFDVARTLGNIANPINYLGPFGMAAKGGKAMSPLFKSVFAGGTGAALQPTEGKEGFWSEKAAQVETGMALGFGLSVAGKVASKGVEALGYQLMKDSPEALQNRAVQAILDRINVDSKFGGGGTAKDMLDLVAAANDKGNPVSLVDVAGRGLKGEAGSIYRRGGAAKPAISSFLENRDSEAAQRLDKYITEGLGSGPSAHQATRALIISRKAAAEPHYAALDNVDYVWSDRLQQFLTAPEVKKGMARGYQLERLDALAENRPFDPTMMGVNLDVDGNIAFTRTPNFRVLDFGKRGLDAMIADERNEVTGEMTALGRSLVKVKQAYVAELDALDKSGEYAKARNIWQGLSAQKDAIGLGRKVFNNNPEVNAELVGELSADQKEFYKIGVADVIRERVLKTGFGADEANSILKNKWARAQLEPAFKSKADYEQFIDSVMNERTMFGTMKDVIKGSPTAERMMGDLLSSENAKLVSGGARAFSDVLHNRLLRGMGHFYRLYREFSSRPDPNVDEAIAKIIFDPKSRESGSAAALLAGPRAVRNPYEAQSRRIQEAVPFVAAGTGEQTD